MVEILLDLLGSKLDLAKAGQILYITLVRSGGSGFGEENLPLGPPALVLGRENPPPIDRSVGSS